MNSPARRKAAAAHNDKLRAEGWRKITFRASPDMQADLAALIARHGSLQSAMQAALSTARAQVSQP